MRIFEQDKLRIGQRIEHYCFGAGSVEQVNGKSVLVRFDAKSWPHFGRAWCGQENVERLEP